VNSFSGFIGSPTVSSTAWLFLGPTTTVVSSTVNELLVGSATVPIATTAAAAPLELDLCYQSTSPGSVVTNFKGNGFSIIEIGTERTAQGISATTRPGAGTYTVGACARLQTAGSIQLNDSDFVNGWVMLVNAPTSGGSSPARPRSARR
jgi:hypothetical protein